MPARGRAEQAAKQQACPLARLRVPDSGRFQTPLLLPAAAEGAVDLHERGELAGLRLREAQLRAEESRVGVEDLEVARRAALVAELREPPRVLRRADQQPLLLAEFTRPAIADQRIGHLAERVLDRLLIGEHQLLLACLRLRDLRSDAARCEDRRCSRRGQAPYRARAREERAQRRALESTGAGQG